MDKIYSRNRIKIPKIKYTRIFKFRIFILGFFFIVLASIISFVMASYPIFIASCENAAASKSVNIIADEVNNVMNNYEYNDLIQIEKDSNGKVVLMKANVVLINKIISTINKNIQSQIDKSSTTLVYINYGSVSRNKYFKEFWT